jgi:hypothetical protein
LGLDAADAGRNHGGALPSPSPSPGTANGDDKLYTASSTQDSIVDTQAPETTSFSATQASSRQFVGAQPAMTPIMSA